MTTKSDFVFAQPRPKCDISRLLNDLRLNSHAAPSGVLQTRYDALSCAYGGSNEKARQSSQRSG